MGLLSLISGRSNLRAIAGLALNISIGNEC